MFHIFGSVIIWNKKDVWLIFAMIDYPEYKLASWTIRKPVGKKSCLTGDSFVIVHRL